MRYAHYVVFLRLLNICVLLGVVKKLFLYCFIYNSTHFCAKSELLRILELRIF